MRRALVAAAACLALLASCDDDSGNARSATGPTLAPPEGLPDFYGVPDPIPDVGPGTLLRSETVDVAGLNGTTHRVMYASESIAGESIVVTGVVAVPDRPAPAEGYPVIATAHGTTGIADGCAPSVIGQGATASTNGLLDAGYVVAATDYEGLGTPGRHPYLVGESAARGVLDSVRAAGQLDGVGTSGRYAVWGFSQGGHAALFALRRAEAYAPELDLVGVVAVAPPSQLESVFTLFSDAPDPSVLLLLVTGFNAAYGDAAAPLDAVMTQGGLAAIDLVDDGCDLGAATAHLEPLVLADPATVPAWRVLARENDPGLFSEPSPAPLLVIHGGADELIPASFSALMHDQLCAIGQVATRWVYPGRGHGEVLAPSADDTLNWIDHRFADEPTPDPMQPTGQREVETQSCPST